MVVKEEIYNNSRWLDFIVRVIKAPMVVLIERVADHLPQPTKENMHHPNTFILIELEEEFFKYEDNPGRYRMFKGIWKFLIFLYDYDSYYRDRIDFVLERWKTKTWELRKPKRPHKAFWREWDTIKE